ncbi:MAG: VWA domain-containing protein [Bacteroidaceae bacterium]|nr:VWA domain-containing protein [Bacteroidaceae bacterium]
MKNKLLIACMALFCATFVFTACSSDDDDENQVLVPGIPSDTQAKQNPALPDVANTVIPNLVYTVEEVNGRLVIRFDLTGIQNPNDLAEWLRLYGTTVSNQNVWLSIDGQPKGFTVVNTIDEKSGQVAAADLVFLVDNSGSMDEEADAVARDIIAWSAKLTKTLDIQFGCVGYDVSGYVNGAYDFNTADNLSAYLDREGYNNYGTYRTMGFVDDNLKGKAENYGRVYDECGVMALRFANDYFSFRKNVNRVYVNFTDEPNQPNYESKWSVEWVKDLSNWPTTNGTIHTVFSEDSTSYSYYWKELYYERPWMLSEYTGGTSIFTDPYFTDVTLDDLPITGALQNSYYMRLTNVDNLFDGNPHTVKITILTPDGKVRAEREYTLIFEK